MRREAQFVFMIAMRIFSILVLQKPFKKRLTTCHEFACYLTDSNEPILLFLKAFIRFIS